MLFKILLLILGYILFQLYLIFIEGLEILHLNIEELINIIWG